MKPVLSTQYSVLGIRAVFGLVVACLGVAADPLAPQAREVRFGEGRVCRVELDARGNVKANEVDYHTSRPKLFAAGDMRRGQSLVVWAIREGRQAAAAIDKFLMGTTTLPR